MSYLQKKDLPQLYEKEKKSLHSFLFSLTGNADEAEDLLHITFERLIPLVEEERIKKDTAGAYLFKMARNISLQWLRERRSSRKREDDFSRDRRSQEPADSEVQLRSFLDRFLGDGNGNLTERQKEILFFRLFTPRAAEDVYRLMRISRRTYYRDLEGAIVLLKEKLTEEGFFPWEDI